VTSRHYIWAIHDVEDWSSRPAVIQARIQQVLRRVEARALAEAGLDPVRVGRQSTGDGAVLAIPGDVPKELIATKYVDALCEGIDDHDAECGAAETIRLRLALHAGESPAGQDEWAGPGIVTASRLLEAAVLRRVLATATGSALALIVSDDWYRAVVKEGYAPGEGYQQVWVEAKKFADFAWVRVPGRTQPPGLLPEDRQKPHRDDRSPGAGAEGSAATHPAPASGASISNSGTIGAFGDFRGAVVHGDVGFGNNYYGTDPGQDGNPRRPGGTR
jgi:hypothetical protein